MVLTRTPAFLPLALALVVVLGTAAASPAEDAQRTLDETLHALGTSLDMAAASGGSDEAAPAAGSRAGPADSIATHNALIAPIAGAATGVIELGLQIIAGFFLGIGQGAATFADAASTVAEAPLASAGIAAGAVGVLGLLSLLAFALHRYGTLGALPLFTRIAKSQILDNRVRNDIFELIRTNPGINVSEIARRLDIAWGTATHHLQKLRVERLVGVRLVNHQKCYFENGGTYTPREMDVVSATKNETARRIAEFVASKGPTTHRDVAVGLGLSPALVTFHARKLVQAGVIAREQAGRRTVFAPLETNLRPTPRPAVHAI